MTTFPVYFLEGALNAAGWPRRVGILRRQVIDRGLLEAVYSDLLRRGITLGAGMPRLAVQLLADNFQERNWQHQPADDLLLQLRGTPGMVFGGPSIPLRFLLGANAEDEPWQRFLITRLSEDPVPVARMNNREFLGLLHWNFGAALLWGLGHPKTAVRALKREHRKGKEALPELRKAGLDLPSDYKQPSALDVLKESVELVANFESRMRPLSALPPELASHRRIQTYLRRRNRL